mgnify:FL=1
MRIITWKEYEEFKQLRSIYKHDAIRQSALRIMYLEQDIDAPIKICVMALALLGCEPMWSCCGFDYAGQPLHKSHCYGTSGVALRDNPRTRWLTKQLEETRLEFQDYANAWRVAYTNHYGDARCGLTSDTHTGNVWPHIDSIHYSEPAAIAIQILETFLLGLSESFQDCVTLRDTNDEFHKRFSWWQYPAKADWLIRKSDLVAVPE